MSDDKQGIDPETLRMYFSMAKFVLAAITLIVMTMTVVNGLEDRELAREDHRQLTRFRNDAIHERVELRRRLAEFFSKASVQQDSRDRWQTYLIHLEQKQIRHASELRLVAELQAELDRLIASGGASPEEVAETRTRLANAEDTAKRLEVELGSVTLSRPDVVMAQ